MTDPTRISDDQHNNAPAVPQGYEIHEIPADYSGLVWLEGQVRAVARRAQAATGPQGWTDADSDAARLALELECLLMDTKDLSVVSKWWGSANEALELHRQRLAATPATKPAQEVGLTDEQKQAVRVMQWLDSGEWELVRSQPLSFLTDEANAESAWLVRRQAAPYCDKSGTRQWAAKTAFGAFTQAIAALRAKGGK